MKTQRFRARFNSRVSRTVRGTLVLVLVAGCGSAPDAEELEPTVVEGEAISADGVTIRYDVRGSGDPAIVLVHGWTNPREIWGMHPQTLSTTNRVVALDLAGHGVSDANRADWSMDAFGEDIVAVVDQLALDRMVLVGFSMGTGVVLEAAERLGDRVTGVVFIDALKDPDWTPNPADLDVEQFSAQVRAVWGDTAWVRAFAFTPEAPDSLITFVAGMMPEEPYEHWFTVAREYDAWMATDLRPTLERLDVPMAAINTPMPPTKVEAWQRYSPSFTVDTMAGIGHAGILLQRTEDFDALLRAIVDRFTAEPSGATNVESE